MAEDGEEMSDPYEGLSADISGIPLRPYRAEDPFWISDIAGNVDRLKWSMSPENFALALERGVLRLEDR